MKTGSSYEVLPFQRPKISIFYTFHYNKAVGIAIEEGTGVFVGCLLKKRTRFIFIPVSAAAAEKGALLDFGVDRPTVQRVCWGPSCWSGSCIISRDSSLEIQVSALYNIERFVRFAKKFIKSLLDPLTCFSACLQLSISPYQYLALIRA